MSFDSPEKNTEFKEAEGFQYELWTDSDKTLAIAYGAAKNENAVWADRITVVLDAQGKQLLEYVEDIEVGTHPAQVLEDCQILFGS